jgi:rare lipoprotein A (peptidoglycan hydrolase)
LKIALIGIAALLLFQGCALMKRTDTASDPGGSAVSPDGSWPKSIAVEVGHASWYGPGFHGKKTASGQVFDQRQLTAAHRTLPLGSKVRVVNLNNDRSVVVVINDRGPFVDGRIIDLSHAAASELGMLGGGTTRVRLEIYSVY